VNQAEKERYLREYEVLKKKGKPFFPYAVFKDATMMLVVFVVIAVLAIVLGAEQGPKVDPTTTTYTPRPEWYFFFLFELLRVLKPVYLVPLATFGIPTIAMVALLLLPFYDRRPERRPERRPVAMAVMVMTILAMAYLTYEGANTGAPTQIVQKIPTSQAGLSVTPAEFKTLNAGRQVVAQSGCLACHKLGENGNAGPGPTLTHIGSRIPRNGILRSLRAGPGIMPSFQQCPSGASSSGAGASGSEPGPPTCLSPRKLHAIADYLASLH
jgi:menaquinol-cytochrome c reductase cytochrome b/c subunit